MRNTSHIPYSEIIDAAEKTARALVGGNYTVDASGGRTACVSPAIGGGYRVSLPSLPPGTMLNRAEADEILGFLVHELSHVAFTTFPIMSDAQRIGGARLGRTLNLLEDLRIEARICTVERNRVPNAPYVLSACAERVARLAYGPTGSPWPGNLEGDVFQALCLAGRLEHVGLTIPSAERLAKECPNDAARWRIYTHVIASLPACKSTHDCLQLAQWLLSAIDAELAKQKAAQQEAQQAGQAWPSWKQKTRQTPCWNRSTKMIWIPSCNASLMGALRTFGLLW